MTAPTDRRDIWVCEGRVCTGNGAAAVAAAVVGAVEARASDERARVRVLRGGCYGLCDMGPNVVVRDADAGRSDVAADRLTLTGGPREHVCVALRAADAAPLVDSVVVDGAPPEHLLRAAREPGLVPRSPIEERMRALRARRASPSSSSSPSSPSSSSSSSPSSSEPSSGAGTGGQGT